MTQHDRRQLLNMQRAIYNYKDNKFFLNSFINTMDFLYREIDENKKTWNHSIVNELIELDSINAGVPDDSSEELIQNILQESVFNLEKLVNERLLELGVIRITFRELNEKYIALLNDTISREEAANWAYHMTQQEELENVIYIPFHDKEKILSNLLFLCEIDHKNPSGIYRSNKEDIKEKLKENVTENWVCILFNKLIERLLSL